MEPALSSDESCDSELKNMKSQLSEFGLDEDNLSKEEMSDLLKALNNSKSTVKEDDLLRTKQSEEPPSDSPSKPLKRRYINVRDRRLPWSLFPNPLTQAEKARTLAVYIKLMSINSYRQARQSAQFASWPPPIQIVEDGTTRVQPIRSTRSGRSVPVYAPIDDDSSDVDFISVKAKKRKTSNSENANGTTKLSLKRKVGKDDNLRPIKEQKMSSKGDNENNINVYTFFED